MVDEVGCSHLRMPILFLEMLVEAANPHKLCQFRAVPCQSKEDWKLGNCFSLDKAEQPIIGYLTDFHNKKQGTYYVDTQTNKSDGEYCGEYSLFDQF